MFSTLTITIIVSINVLLILVLVVDVPEGTMPLYGLVPVVVLCKYTTSLHLARVSDPVIAYAKDSGQTGPEV